VAVSSETIRYGVIGSGMMGGEHILDLNHIDGAQVVALADPVASSIEWGLGCVAVGPSGETAKERTASTPIIATCSPIRTSMW